jgi:ribulose-phosphate 3-epimerase
MIKIAPSILSADYSILGKEIKAVEEGGADWIHVDVMDGHFVPNITIGPLVVKAARKCTRLPLDVHLMIENPDNYIKEFRDAGADIITVHAEACPHLHRTVQLIKNVGARPGVVLNPATSLDSLDFILSEIDLVLLMSVNPGFGGQSFIESTLQKIRLLREMAKTANSLLEIEIDGGVKKENASSIIQAGADILVAGSEIFRSKDYGDIIGRLKGK